MKKKINYFKNIFILIFLMNAVLCTAQTDSFFDISGTAIFCDPVLTYVPEPDTYDKFPLYLTDKIENFDYTGRFRCLILIDTLEKIIIQVTITGIQISNGTDSIFIKIPKDVPISEYSGEHSDIVRKMYPFMKNHVLGLKLIRDKYGTPKRHGRFYQYGIVIKIL